MPGTEFIDLLKVYGPTMVITAVFVWQAVIREKRMSARIDHLEDKLTTVLESTVQRNTDAFHAFTHALQQQHKIVTP